MKKLIIALAFLVCSPAIAQWQTPTNTIPYGRGPGVTGFNSIANNGTGANCLLNTAPPAFGNCIPSGILNVINAVCTLTPKPCSYLFGFYSPQWFGAVCYALGSSLVLMTVDSASAIQATVNQIASDGGGKLQFSSCAYKIIAGITISGHSTSIKGTGFNSTQIIYAPTTPGFAFQFSAGAGILLNSEIADLAILSGEITLTKIAIGFSDVSTAIVHNINIAHYPQDGTLWRSGSGTGVGLSIAGRELGDVQNMQIYAEQPIRISLDPNLGLAGAIDSWTFDNLILIAPLTSATTSCITLDDGVGISNLRFTGHQNWIGGVDGFRWIDTTGTAVSNGLYISGVKDEQPGAVGGYTVNIRPNQLLFNFNFANSTNGPRNGILMRKVFNATLAGTFYDQASGPTKIGLDADLSNTIIDFRGTIWPTGTLSSLGAFSTSGIVIPTGTVAALPGSGVFYK